MKKFLARPRLGPERVIEAPSEEAARAIAMRLAYGPPVYQFPNRGEGLWIEEVRG